MRDTWQSNPRLDANASKYYLLFKQHLLHNLVQRYHARCACVQSPVKHVVVANRNRNKLTSTDHTEPITPRTRRIALPQRNDDNDDWAVFCIDPYWSMYKDLLLTCRIQVRGQTKTRDRRTRTSLSWGRIIKCSTLILTDSYSGPLPLTLPNPAQSHFSYYLLTPKTREWLPESHDILLWVTLMEK